MVRHVVTIVDDHSTIRQRPTVRRFVLENIQSARKNN